MEKLKISWVVVILLFGYLDPTLGQTCGYTEWSSYPHHSCDDYYDDTVPIYQDKMASGETKMECCERDDTLIANKTRDALHCGMSPCSANPAKIHCPTRTITDKESTPFDEILREKCTTEDEKVGYTSYCCPKGSVEGQLAATLGAEPYEFPHMAKALLTLSCGGTIYNKRFIITAAHCFVTDKGKVDSVKEMKVIIGSNSGDNEDKKYVYKVKKAIPHPNYSKLSSNMKTLGDKYLNDVGLLELDRDIEFGPNVKALRIAEPDFEPRDYANDTIIVGWGTTDTLDVSIHLQKANFVLREPRNCFENNYMAAQPAPHEEYEEYQDQLLCVGGVLEGKWSPTAGGGDSGGPAICRGPDGRALLCGVTSFGGFDDECAEHKDEMHCWPSVYARVSYFNGWIKKIAGKPADEKHIYKPFVYGEPVSKGMYDHQVHITSETGKSCGGTLVSQDIVVTAASCVVQDDGTGHEGLKVYYGLKDLEKGKPAKTFDVAGTAILGGFQMVGQKVNVEAQGNRVVVTDNFYKNNLAVIKIDGKAPISPNKIPGLPGKGKIFVEGKEIAFPRSSYHGGQLSLRDYHILDKEECQKRMTRLGKGEETKSIKVGKDILCGVEKYSGGSLCDRELGGGLICKGKNGKDVLCGVQIFRLCSLSIPNGFIDMSKKSSWVKTAMTQL